MRDPPGDSAEPLRREDDCRGAAVGPMEGSVFPSLGPDHCHRRCLPLGEGRQYRQAGVLVAIRLTATITRDYGSGGLLHQVSLIRIAGACGVLRLLSSGRAGPSPQGVAAADASIPAPLLAWACAPPYGENASRRGLVPRRRALHRVAAALEVIRELDLSMTRGRTWRRVERGARTDAGACAVGSGEVRERASTFPARSEKMAKISSAKNYACDQPSALPTGPEIIVKPSVEIERPHKRHCFNSTVKFLPLHTKIRGMFCWPIR